jgi:hypothetical protein
MMQRLFSRNWILMLAAIVGFTVAARADQAPSRFARTVGQYAALGPAEQDEWLRWLLGERLEPACRVTMDAAQYDRSVSENRALVDRVRGGKRLTTEELLGTLAQVDRQEAAAIRRLTEEYRRVTHEAVGTNLWEFQQRMELWEAIKSQCEHSPDPFAGQPKLIAWLESAIIQERISAAPPMPAAPDFLVVDDRAWQGATKRDTPQVKTAVEYRPEPDAEELAPQIARYNTALTKLVSRLYSPQTLRAQEIDSIVDELAKLGLVRIGLAADVLALEAGDRDRLAPIEPIDTAIALAKVKISAARRQIRRAAGGNTSDQAWSELAALNDVARRLDMLATGPDR